MAKPKTNPDKTRELEVSGFKREIIPIETAVNITPAARTVFGAARFNKNVLKNAPIKIPIPQKI